MFEMTKLVNDTLSEAGRFMMFWRAYRSASGGLRPPAGLAAGVGCNKVPKGIWCHTRRAAVS